MDIELKLIKSFTLEICTKKARESPQLQRDPIDTSANKTTINQKINKSKNQNKAER